MSPYFFEADSTQPIRAKEDENSSVAWFTLDEAVEKSSEPWFREHIYRQAEPQLRDPQQIV